MAEAGGGEESSEAANATINEMRRRYFQGQIRSDLFDAVFADSIPGVQQALSRRNVNINQTNGKCPVLHFAAGFASPAIVEILLDAGANVSSEREGCTALHVAACVGKIANICLLLDRGAEIEAVDAAGKTPLFTATTNGQVKAVALLAKRTANVSQRTLQGATPIHCAIKQNRLDIVRVLLFAKADIKIRFAELTPLELALSLDHMDIAEELMRFANLEDNLGRMIFKNEEALAQAAFANMPEAIEMVYNMGARDTTGQALCIAICKRHVECVKALLQCTAANSHVGRYINGARLEGLGWLSSVLHEKAPSVKIVRLLVDAGADTTSAIGVQWGTNPPFASTPVQSLEMALDADSTESGIGEAHLGALKGIIRLFHQVPAVHATSWLWPMAAVRGKRVKKPAARGKRVEKSASRVNRVENSATIARMLPVLRRRAAKRHVLLSALARYNGKLDGVFLGSGEEGGSGSK